MSSLLPQQKQPKLIVVVAIDHDQNGDLQTVFGPAEQQNEERAIRTAKSLAPSMPAPSLGAERPIPRSVSKARHCSMTRLPFVSKKC